MTDTTITNETTTVPEVERKRLRTVLPKSVYQRLQHAAVDRERPANDLVVEAVEQYLSARSPE